MSDLNTISLRPNNETLEHIHQELRISCSESTFRKWHLLGMKLLWLCSAGTFAVGYDASTFLSGINRYILHVVHPGVSGYEGQH